MRVKVFFDERGRIGAAIQKWLDELGADFDIIAMTQTVANAAGWITITIIVQERHNAVTIN